MHVPGMRRRHMNRPGAPVLALFFDCEHSDKLSLPSVEELRAEIETQKRFFLLQQQEEQK